MNFEDFFNSLDTQSVELPIQPTLKSEIILLNNEALFQLPLISLVILALANEKSKPRVVRIGNLVGHCFEETFTAYKKSSQYIAWSANLRIRTVKALNFLEISNLIEINKKNQTIEATTLGKKLYQKVINTENNLSYNLNLIKFNYRNIRKSEQVQLGL